MASLELDRVKKSFGHVEILHGLSLTIAKGSFVSLLGPSGCGKTTLLRLVAGLENVDSGAIRIDGHDVAHLPPEKRDIAMMFQSYALLPHLNVAENVRFPLRMRKIGTRDEQEENVTAALEMVQLTGRREHKIHALSGGQQQRVALARAIVSKPQLLLLDEPLSNLDARLREDMQVELREIHRKLQLTTLFVTHDQEEALSLSGRIVLINQGRIEQEGSPQEIYTSPRSDFAAHFLGAANILSVEIKQNPQGWVALLGDGQTLPLPANSGSSGNGAKKSAKIILRQEDMRLQAQAPTDKPALQGKVLTKIYLGHQSRYLLKIGGEEIRVLCSNDMTFERGDKVFITLAPASILLI